jgi:hypothetical protein
MLTLYIGGVGKADVKRLLEQRRNPTLKIVVSNDVEAGPILNITIVATAFAALLSQMELAVFNDGVRPFFLDFYRGDLSRAQMATIAFELSAGFLFGLGVPVAFSSGVLNPWVLFLPTDILGILSPKKRMRSIRYSLQMSLVSGNMLPTLSLWVF